MQCHLNSEWWLNYRTGTLCAVIWNTSGASKPKKASDFMPLHLDNQVVVKEETPVSEAQFIDALRIMNAAHGGKETKLEK